MSGMGDEIVENGLSPLDGILPQDPKFGRIEEGDLEPVVTPKLSDLLVGPEKKIDTPLVNGVRLTELMQVKLIINRQRILNNGLIDANPSRQTTNK